MSYFVYAIVTNDLPSDRKAYIGITKSLNPKYNALTVMSKRVQNYSDDKYIKLRESLKTEGIKSHTYRKLSERMELEEAEKLAFEHMNKLGNRCLNDSLIDPEREECDRCGKRVKLAFLEAHKSKYCVETSPEELFGFTLDN